MKIFVALWARDTERKLTGTQERRFEMLQSAVQKAAVAYERVSGPALADYSGAIKSIFVAPEYLFTRSEEEDRGQFGRAISIKDANAILTKITGLSAAQPGMLLVPGTMIYQHRLKRHTGGKAGAIASMRATQQALPRFGSGDLTGLAPGNKPELKLSAKMLRLETESDETYVVKNRVYIFLDGEVKAYYGKRGDQVEVLPNVPGVFIPGRTSGLETIGGINFGFEICFDHDIGVLKKQSGSTKVDLHVICSASVPNSVGNMNCRNGGFVLHASSSQEATTVYYKPRTLPVPAGDPLADEFIEVLAGEDSDGDPLKYYVINLV